MKIKSIFSRKSTTSKDNGRDVEENSNIVDNLNNATLLSDNPINQLEDDTLGRAEFAQLFARQVLSLDTRLGNVVGVLGAWGLGKTSFVNLARNEFQSAGVEVLDFNPWMFSGAEQLVESFFIELSAQLKLKPELSEIGKELGEYGEIFSGMSWLPFVGPWIDRSQGAIKILSQILNRRKEGVGGRRAKIEKALINSNKKIIIVLDDIDRLSTSEIRDIFKLVRLMANFPNIIYIVAFDRARVEEALSEHGIPGRDYLEKILQVTVDLPFIPNHVINTQVFSAINNSLKDIERTGPFYEEEWPDIFMEIIRPLIRNMRDIRRYAITIRGTVDTLSGNVALTDVLALEAIRIFLPDVFGLMHQDIEALTSTSDINYRSDNPELKMKIDKLIEISGKHQDVIRAMIERLFPAAKRYISNTHYGSEWKNKWLRDRRVAHEDILRLYLERFVCESLKSFLDAEQAWMYMTEKDSLENYLRSLDITRLQDIIASLEAYEDQFSSKQVTPTTIALLNLLPDIPKRQQGMFDIDTRTVVMRVIYRLLRALKNPNAVELATREILSQIKSLSSKLEIVNIVGYRENVGHKLVSQSVAAELEKKWREEVQTSKLEDLLTESEILSVLYIARKKAVEIGETFTISDSPQLTLAILKNAQSEVKSQTMGNRAVRRTSQLAWNTLIELYGDEGTLKDCIEKLKLTKPEHVDDLLELANKYIKGWRPEN